MFIWRFDMAKLGRLFGTIASTLVGGPLVGLAAYGVGEVIHAKRGTKREMLVQGEHIRNAGAKADKIAKEQGAANERALQKISQGRVRAASRRVRGGLFGDAGGSSPSYAAAQKLGS